MSRLIDKFLKAANASPQPMGFRTSNAAPPVPGMPLIVSATQEALKGVTEIEIASAVLVRPEGALTAKNLQKTADTLPDIPLGLYIEDTDDAEVAALADAGCDFFVFPASGRVFTMPAGKKAGRIIEVESSMDDSLLVAVNTLPVDAVIAGDTFTGGALSWHELMIFQHLANIFSKPLIVNFSPDISEAEMKALWEAGIDGAIVEAAALKEGDLKKLQEAILKLPPRATRKRGKIDVFLPRAGGEMRPAPPPDEEEEEDE
jgi:hypothetical protein